VDELLAGTGLAGLFGMLNIAFAFVLALVTPAFAQPTDSRVAPPPAKSDNRPVQHGAQPNPEEVRPGSPQGDALVAILALAGVVIPRARRRDRARGGGSYGRP